MGLLDRIRSGRQADHTPATPDVAAPAAAPELPAEPVASEDVITARDLWDVPEWQKVPPIEPVIEEPPWIIEPSFDKSLVSWQPPEQFIGDLGHSVSDAAPSGVVDGLAVLSSTPSVQTLADDDAAEPAADLPLVARAGGREGAEPSVTVRRLPGYQDSDELPPDSQATDPWTATTDEAQPDGEPATIAPEDDLPLVVPPSALDQPDAPTFAEAPPSDYQPATRQEAGPEPVSELVGAAPIAPVVQTLVAAEPPSTRLVQADTPPELPLVQLPSAPLPAEMRRAPAPAAPVDETTPSPAVLPGPEIDAPLTADRTIRETSDAPLVAASPEAQPVEQEPAEADLPLAQPPAAAHDDGPGPMTAPSGLESLEAESEPEPEEVAPILSHAPPMAPEPESLPGAEEPVVSAGGDPDPTDQPLAATARQAGPLPAPSVTVSREVDTSGPSEPAPRPRRLGFGDPLPSLPPTAVSWDITKMSRDQVVRLQRQLMRSGSPISSDKPLQALMESSKSSSPLPLASPRPAAASGPSVDAPDESSHNPAGPAVPIEPFDAAESPDPSEAPPEDPQKDAPILGKAPLIGPQPESAGEAYQAPDVSSGGEVRATIGNQHNLDLSTVPVYRTGQAATDAQSLQARAFTSPAGVVIPASAGSLDTGEGSSLLAHELTHVAQRMRYDSDLPTEDSFDGRAMEAEAHVAEMAYSTPSAVRTLARPSQPTRALQRDTDPLPLASRGGGVDEDAIASSVVDRLQGFSAPPEGGPFTTQLTGSPWSAMPPTMGVQRAAETATAPPPPTTNTDQPATSTPPASTASPTAPSPFAQRPTNEELNNLSHWLYPLISHKIKGELREGRERLGLITDHYRRW